MTSPEPIESVLTTVHGDVCIRSFCRSAEIKRYGFDAQFGVSDDYKSLYTQRESLEKIADQDTANVVIALDKKNTIIGFGVLADPDPQERWTQLGPELMMEVKAIEVSRSWRSAGIAPRMLALLLKHPRIEEMIVYLVGYSWTWDLKGTGKSAEEYSQALIQLFAAFGFRQYETNEPNVCLKPENFLMGRIGSNVSPQMVDRFKWLRYDLNLWSWSVG
jgi:acetoin utilization protein AcuA